MARLEPCPTISAALPSANSHCTAASTSLASRAFSVSAITDLEPRDVRKRHPAGVDMHAAELGTAVQRREHLAGIEQPALVESALEPLLLVEIGLGKHRRHQVALLHPDAVLAGKHAAHLDTELEDVRAKRFGL